MSDVDSATMVEARGLTVRFKKFTALDDISCSFGGTGVCGLVGANGAGKTSLIHTVLGLVAASGGQIEVVGDATSISYCPDTPSFEPWLTAREVVEQSHTLGRSRSARSSASVGECLDRVGLADAADRRTGGFSRGMRQRLGVAAALVRQPSMLLLDEPTSALDPVGRDQLLTLVRELGSEMLVVLSSHILDDVESVADRLVVLHRGRLLYSGPTAVFIAGSAPRAQVLVRLEPGSEDVIDALSVRGVRPLSAQGTAEITMSGDDFATVLGVLTNWPERVISIARSAGSLQSAFLTVVALEEARSC